MNIYYSVAHIMNESPIHSHCHIFTFEYHTRLPSQSVLSPTFISTYNVAYTSLPVVIMGTMDQDVTPRTATRFPGLYYPGIAKLWFSRKVFSNFAIHGLITSLVLIGFIMGKIGFSACVATLYVHFRIAFVCGCIVGFVLRLDNLIL